MFKLNKVESWDDITVNQFIELSELEDNLSYYDRCIAVFSIINDTDAESFADINFTQMAILMEELTWMSQPPTNKHKKSINNKLFYKDINESTLGDFIDVNFYLEKPITNIKEICSIVYRKYVLNKFDEKEWNASNISNANMFKDLPITDVFGILKIVIDYKTMITSSYENHFNPSFDNTDDDDYELDEEDIELDKQEAIANNWAWENLLHKLSNGDITKYGDILNLPIIFVMNSLSHIKDMKL